MNADARLRAALRDTLALDALSRARTEIAAAKAAAETVASTLWFERLEHDIDGVLADYGITPPGIVRDQSPKQEH